MTGGDYDAHKLDEAISREIYEEQIKPWLFKGIKPAEKPAFVLLGGQPGAGKSASVEAAQRVFTDAGGIVAVIGDDLRRFHPKNRELMRADDKTAALYTAADSGRWVEMAAREARAMRANVLMETTLRRPELAAYTIGEFKKGGYVIDVRVLAVPRELSEQGVLMRYEGQKADRGSGRMTPPEIHDAAYKSLPESVRRIEAERLTDSITVYRRGNVPIYSNHLVQGQWQAPPRAMDVIERERNRPWSRDELAQYVAGNEQLSKLLDAPGRRATPDEQQALARITKEGEAAACARSGSPGTGRTG